jgi:hypothetical protein
MNPSNPPTPATSQLVDIVALQKSGIFPIARPPSIRTLREWTRLKRLPHHRVGHFVYYDLADIAAHIRTKLKVPARG